LCFGLLFDQCRPNTQQTMNPNNLAIKTQEALQKAQMIALGNEQQAIEPGHVLKGVFETDDHVASFLLKKLGANVEAIRSALDRMVEKYPKVTGGNQYLSNDSAKMLAEANKFLKDFEDEYVAIEHLLLAALKVKDSVAQLLKDSGVDEKNLKAAIREMRKGKKVDSASAEDTYNALDKYAINLNKMANEGKLDPVIGRDDEIRRVLQILSRRTKNNPILIGEAGVGKTAIAEGIAHRIINGDVPDNLQKKLFYSLDMGALIAGAKYKGEFEERLKSVVKEVTSSDGDIVLFIDEIHTLVGAGGGEGAMDAANILKPALARGELRAVGATTLNEYQKYFEKDKALERRFQTVLVDEPDMQDAISILRGLKEKYETHHKVRIKDEAIIAAVELSTRYITDRNLPDKAIDLIDEAAAKLRIAINSMPEQLDEVERKLRQLEIEREAIKREKDQKKLDQLSEEIAELADERNQLHSKWQEEKTIVESIQSAKEEIESLKMEAERAEREGDLGRVAEIRYGKLIELKDQLKNREIKLAEMQASGSQMLKEEVEAEDIAEVVSKWSGVPVTKMLKSEIEKLLNMEDELHKRVVGQEEAIQVLSDAVRRNRAGLSDKNRPVGSFIFMGTTGVGKTELAKALADFLFNNEGALTRIDMSEYQERHSVSRLVGAPPGYVGYDEGGQLTEAVRRKPYSVILLDEIEKAHPDVFNILLQVLDDGRLTDNKGRVANFKNCMIIMTSNLGSDVIYQNFEDADKMPKEKILEKTREDLMELMKQSLKPEFLNRIDDIILFSPLFKEEIVQIVKMHLKKLVDMLKEQDVILRFTKDSMEMLAEKGYDPQFGARPVKRLIQREILNELSKRLLDGTVEKGTEVVLDNFDGNFVFRQAIETDDLVEMDA
jgi:ATP-dependent Clp protease ATP-binding subunit ClpB